MVAYKLCGSRCRRSSPRRSRRRSRRLGIESSGGRRRGPYRVGLSWRCLRGGAAGGAVHPIVEAAGHGQLASLEAVADSATVGMITGGILGYGIGRGSAAYYGSDMGALNSASLDAVGRATKGGQTMSAALETETGVDTAGSKNSGNKQPISEDVRKTASEHYVQGSNRRSCAELGCITAAKTDGWVEGGWSVARRNGTSELTPACDSCIGNFSAYGVRDAYGPLTFGNASIVGGSAGSYGRQNDD
jgi:hypothetical protein